MHTEISWKIGRLLVLKRDLPGGVESKWQAQIGDPASPPPVQAVIPPGQSSRCAAMCVCLLCACGFTIPKHFSDVSPHKISIPLVMSPHLEAWVTEGARSKEMMWR